MRTPVFVMLGLLLAVVGASCTSAQSTLGVQGGTMRPGLVLVAKVVGTAKVDSAGVTGSLKVNDSVPPGSLVTTGENSRLVLVFANGASVFLGSNTEIVIEEFSLEPLTRVVRLSELDEEPTKSHTRIHLYRGELVAKVKLRKDGASMFTVLTPVGAAGIRGTTFRIVYQPAPNGMAYFNLSNANGMVVFSPNAGSGGVAGLSVPPSQQIEVVTSFTQNAQGQRVAVAPVTSAACMPIPIAVIEQITAAAGEMAESVQQATFAPTPGSKAQSAPAPRPAPPPLRRPVPTPGSPPVTPSAKPADLPPGPLTLQDAIRYFEKWGGHAEWADELTEFTIDSRLPSGQVQRQYFEVQRDGAAFSLREIAGLTRPLIDHGTLVLPPLNFTETAEMNAAYYRANPGAVPGQFVIPPGGPFPRPPKPPVPGVIKNAAGSNVAGGAAGTPASRTITINGVAASGVTFTGTVTVTPAAPTPPPPTPPRVVPPRVVPPRKTNPGG